MITDNEIIVDDELISIEQQIEIKKFFDNNQFPWYRFHENLTSSFDVYDQLKHVDSDIFEHGQLYHCFIDKGNINSQLTNVPMFIFERIKEKYTIPSDLFRIKANLCTKVWNENQNSHQTPHVDQFFDHIGILYYVNDSDGDTFFFDKKIDCLDDYKKIKNLNVIKRVTPKQGRCIIFNGKILHAGMHPRINDYRIVINFNIKS